MFKNGLKVISKAILKYLKMAGVLLLLSVILPGCQPTPGYAQPVGPGWSVTCDRVEVQASITAISPLDKMTLNQQSALKSGGYVWTGYKGQAKLTKSTCTIYTFYKSSVYVTEGTVAANCSSTNWPQDCYASSTVTVNNCTVNIVTPPAGVKLSATWVTLAYVEEYQLLLIMAHEHSALVTPMIPPDGLKPSSQPPFTVDEGTFAYTLPEDKIPLLAQVMDINRYPAYTNFSIQDIGNVARPLQLAARLQEVNNVLIQSNVPNQIPPDVLNMQQIMVYGGGPDLSDPSVHDTLRLGVDWTRLGTQAYPGREVQMMARLGSDGTFTPLIGFDQNISLGQRDKIALNVILDNAIPAADQFQKDLQSRLTELGFDPTTGLADTVAGNTQYLGNVNEKKNALFITIH